MDTKETYNELFAKLRERYASGRLIGTATLGDPVRVFRANDEAALFVVADVLSYLGYQNLSKGTAQHLRRPPVAIHQVRLSGKRGFPFVAAVDSIGVEWLINKTRPRTRKRDDGLGFEEELDQADDIEAFRASWRRCLSYLPDTRPVKYPDLEATSYTLEERSVANKALALLMEQTKRDGAANGSAIAAAFGSFFDYSVLSSVVRGSGPWNLKGPAIP